jgi:biotin-(acetyl-CoA carboxylase) ligase
VLLYADHRSALESIGATAAGRTLAPPALPDALVAAWRRLGGVSAVAGVAPPASPAHGDTPVLVVERAPRSQFVELQEALRDGEHLPDDLVTIALEGEGFRGQRGRSWQALRGNLHLCRLARLDLPAAESGGALVALPAVATAEAIERATLGAVRIDIKWVNDLLLGGRKVGGVLSATSLQGEQTRHVLLGIGVNVTRVPDVPREPGTPPAGAIAETYGDAALAPLTWALHAALDVAVARLRAGEGATLVAAYRDRSIVVGRRVSLWPAEAARHPAPIARGRVSALRDDLALEIEGHAAPVWSGRLVLEDG